MKILENIIVWLGKKQEEIKKKPVKLSIGYAVYREPGTIYKTDELPSEAIQ